MKQQSPVARIWELGEKEHPKLILAVVLVVLGVMGGMVPYFAAAKTIVLLLAGETAFAVYAPWLAAAFAGFLFRTLLYNGALGLSHKATFNILKTIRQKMLAKLPRLPRNGYRHVRRKTERDHSRSGGRHGNDACAPLSGNDGEPDSAAFNGHLSVCIGFSACASVACRVSSRLCFYDDGHGRLCQGL